MGEQKKKETERMESSEQTQKLGKKVKSQVFDADLMW